LVMNQPDRRYVITYGCPDRTGIVARISQFLADLGGWIVEAAYHTDPDTGWFFTRQEVLAESLPFDGTELRARFADEVAELGGSGKVADTGEERRIVVLVSLLVKFF
jgi:formyltetrahydrofolate deformylase